MSVGGLAPFCTQFLSVSSGQLGLYQMAGLPTQQDNSCYSRWPVSVYSTVFLKPSEAVIATLTISQETNPKEM